MSQQLHPKLIGYWPLDGNALDISGSGNHGTVNGAVPCEAPRGRGYYFDGLDDTIALDASKLPQGDDPFTVSFWAAPDNDKVFFGWGNAGEATRSPHFDHISGDAGSFMLRFCGWAADFDTVVEFDMDGIWHFYAFTHGGGNSYIFRDGIFYTSSVKTYNIGSIAALIGARSDGQNLLEGKINQLMVFSVRLELPDILRIMTGQMPIGV